MKRAAAVRLGLSIMALVVLTFAVPVVANVWAGGSLLLAYADAPAAASAAWTTANLVSASIYAWFPPAAPVAAFQAL